MEYLLRSLLFVPAYNIRFLEKAADCMADAIIFDLEDAVPKAKKREARCILKEYLANRDFGGKQLLIRVNSMESEEFEADIQLAVNNNILGIIVPKINEKADIDELEQRLAALETVHGLEEQRIKVMPLIETAAAVMNIKEIAGSRGRLIGLIYGGEDYLNSIWGNYGNDSSEVFQIPRTMMVLAARMNDLLPIDTPYLNINNIEGFYREKEMVYSMGFAGTLLVNPKQIEAANHCFSPKQEDVVYAERILEAVNAADAGTGSIAMLDGEMIGPPMRKRAEKILHLHSLIERKQNGK